MAPRETSDFSKKEDVEFGGKYKMKPADTLPALVATLGLQPQVITRSLDILLADIEPDLAEVILIHTSAWPYKNPPNWPSLAEFRAHLEKTYPRLRCCWIPIRDAEGNEARDVETPEMAAQVFRIIFREVKRVKQSGRRLHGLIAGGRKSMIVYTMVSAQLLFDIEDRLWHLFSRDEGPAPHLSPENRHYSQLIEIPVLHLAGIMPMVRSLILDNDDPIAAVGLFREHENRERMLRLRDFYESCDVVDQQILLLAYQGYSNGQIADTVYLHETTVSGRFGQIADRFFQLSIVTPPNPLPKNLRLTLLHYMRPYLNKLADE
jgi:CRISPR-associated Csx14 family protein